MKPLSYLLSERWENPKQCEECGKQHFRQKRQPFGNLRREGWCWMEKLKRQCCMKRWVAQNMNQGIAFLILFKPCLYFLFFLSFPTLYSREIKCTFTCLMLKLWLSCIFGWPFWDSPDYIWHTFSLLACHVSFRFILLTRKPLYCSSKKSLKEDRPPFLLPISQKSRVKKHHSAIKPKAQMANRHLVIYWSAMTCLLSGCTPPVNVARMFSPN